MKIWRFADPDDNSFAAATRHGTWRGPDDGVCPECTASRQKRVPPLIMSFDPGSRRIGDFIWPGMSGEIVAGLAAIDRLRPFGGFEPTPVHLIAGRSRTAPALPEQAPILSEITTTRWVDLDAERSAAVRRSLCGTCGAEEWDLDGIERIDSHYDLGARKLVRQRIPRKADAGIFVPRRDLGGDGLFRIRQCPAWIACTDLVAAACRAAGLTNVDFLELGDAV